MPRDRGQPAVENIGAHGYTSLECLDVDSSHKEYQYLKTEFNRNGNSYRNPYTNSYSPEDSNGYRPAGAFRTLEENGAVLFDEYVKQYYGPDTVGNFYVMESEEGNGSFSCGFFAKKGISRVI